MNSLNNMNVKYSIWTFFKYFLPPSNLMAYNKLTQKCQHGFWNRKQYPPHFVLFVLKLLSYFKLTQLINLSIFISAHDIWQIYTLIRNQSSKKVWSSLGNLFHFPHTLCNLTRIAIANKELFIGLHLTRQCRPAALLRINRHAKNI